MPREIVVLPMAVDELKDRRPERRQQRRRWVSPDEVAAPMDEEDLAAPLHGFEAGRAVWAPAVAAAGRDRTPRRPPGPTLPVGRVAPRRRRRLPTMAPMIKLGRPASVPMSPALRARRARSPPAHH